MIQNAVHNIWTPIDLYKKVERMKTSAEKNALVVELANENLIAGNTQTAEVLAQKQLELLTQWCFAPTHLTEPQRKLIDELLSVDSISKVCVLSLEPVFDLYVIGNSNDVNLYDQISDAVVSYKYDNKLSAAYMYMTESEFEHCDRNGIIQVYSR